MYMNNALPIIRDPFERLLRLKPYALSLEPCATDKESLICRKRVNWNLSFS